MRGDDVCGIWRNCVFSFLRKMFSFLRCGLLWYFRFCSKIFSVRLDVEWVVDFPYFDGGRRVAIYWIDWDKSIAVFSPKEDFYGETVPTGGRNTIGFLKSEVMLNFVVIKVENRAAVLKIQGGLCIVMVGDMYLLGEMGAVFKGGGDR